MTSQLYIILTFYIIPLIMSNKIKWYIIRYFDDLRTSWYNHWVHENKLYNTMEDAKKELDVIYQNVLQDYDWDIEDLETNVLDEGQYCVYGLGNYYNANIEAIT